MKVKIGLYKKWWGPYQIAHLLRKVGVSEDRCDDIGDWLSDTWVYPVCLWIHNKRTKNGDQYVDIQIDRYDTYSAYTTLAHVIHATLKQFDEDKIGSGFVDDEDVPGGLRSHNCTPSQKVEHEGTDCNFHKRWDFIVSEVVWTFDQLRGDWEEEFYDQNIAYDDEVRKRKEQKWERIENGLRLFAKYYTGFWW